MTRKLYEPQREQKAIFVLVANGDTEQMIGMAKVQFGVNIHLSRSVEEIHDQRKRITIILRDAIQSMIVDTKLETSVFLFSEENWSTMGGTRQIDEIRFEVLVEELLKCGQLGCGKGINGANQRLSAINSLDLESELVMGRKIVSLRFREDVGEVVVLGRTARQVCKIRLG